jgi:hypothetical protein
MAGNIYATEKKKLKNHALAKNLGQPNARYDSQSHYSAGRAGTRWKIQQLQTFNIVVFCTGHRYFHF